MAKGGGYERELSEKFSLWWSDGKNDELFWRSAGSGGRATVRGKKGMTVTAGAGDIIPVQKDAMPFGQVFCIEAKRGYSAVTPLAMLDALPLPVRKAKPPKPPKPGQKPRKPKPKKPQPSMATWLDQATKAAKSQGIPFFLIVHRRDSKKPVVYFPKLPFLTENDIQGPTMRILAPGFDPLYVAELTEFLKALDPQKVRDYADALEVLEN